MPLPLPWIFFQTAWEDVLGHRLLSLSLSVVHDSMCPTPRKDQLCPSSARRMALWWTKRVNAASTKFRREAQSPRTRVCVESLTPGCALRSGREAKRAGGEPQHQSCSRSWRRGWGGGGGVGVGRHVASQTPYSERAFQVNSEISQGKELLGHESEAPTESWLKHTLQSFVPQFHFSGSGEEQQNLHF